ncbi:MAG TPA: phenylalanine--tRNA ligase subunit beta [Bacillota bacterium]|jgi:phenylalanyl-tRNA synthetase beta chain|nr:phenylalanine--tRNA ligase subunit beta [Bacillota bacterium]HOB86219.1 phenylalanine--tRNA ligase subunit beta [Bacillota bacterium]HOP68759.1 phenylalanine--tRNA ligase subunit beta [Bacillota bacterium]HPT33874.1 phenylalanine--tRNA ligase subunit beta [Bacillota bacterium]HPZ64833.1 phenylalanine--tRNA ligase subunit beta [Bacillota bacterium]
MRVPYNWLKEYVDFDLPPLELADRLTMAGLEVGAVEPWGELFSGVVVGRILAIEPHPRRERLALVRVDRGGGEEVAVVCGARNIKEGQKVPLALPGARLPGLPKPLEALELGGVLSQGMLCSAQELGLELVQEAEGILILDPGAQPGAPLEEVLDLEDSVLVLELTPNRADCLGLLGVAWEVAALTGGKLKLPPVDPPEVEERVENYARVDVEDPDLCPRYAARVIREVAVAPSPLWMQIRLLKAGIRPINNVVDITNYVMWEFGQPLHAFDYERLEGGRIVVRRAYPGEVTVTLDGKMRELNPEILVIADASKTVALGGVMGAENSEIGPETRTVLLEAALFNPVNIRRTARRLGLPSEASQRFERGVNPESVLEAQGRAALLMSRLAGGEVLQGVIDVYPKPFQRCRIAVRPYRVNEIIGKKIPVEEMVNLLERLGFDVQREPNRTLAVTVPLRRSDIQLEEDIVEEVARLHGYENIPTTLPRGELIECREAPELRLHNLVRDTMAAMGFYEVITYSFINPNLLRRLRIGEDTELARAIPLQNPLSEEQGVMRTTLLPGLLKVLQHNFNHQEYNQLLFELGAVFLPRRLPLEELPDERMTLGLAATGAVTEPNWSGGGRQADFYLVKGVLEALFRKLGLGSVDFRPLESPFLHPTRAAGLFLEGEELGYLGELHPEVATDWDLRQAVIVAELNGELLFSRASLVPRLEPLPRYPASLRDISVVVPREITARELESCIREAGGELVDRITLFDLYEGKQIPPGKRSISFAIAYRSSQGTLTDEEVNQIHGRIQQALFALGATLRT